MSENINKFELKILRYLPEKDDSPFYESFYIPISDGMSVLQGLLYIKDNLDGSLGFRWSCRMAICGSCGMMINGVPKLACKTFIYSEIDKTPIIIEPLAHFPIARDLIVEVHRYFERLRDIKPYLIPKEIPDKSDIEYLQTPQQLTRYNQFAACINCMLCYSACPEFGLNPDFIGSGHMSILHRYNADSRDDGYQERIKQINDKNGVWGCTAIGYCSVVCPKQVDPAHAINMYKIHSVVDYFKNLFV